MKHTKLIKKMKEGERLHYAEHMSYIQRYDRDHTNHWDTKSFGAPYLRSSLIYALEERDDPEPILWYAKTLGLFTDRELRVLETHFL